MKATLNCSTGEVTMEPYTAEEVAQMEIDKAASVERAALEAAEKEAADTLKASGIAKLIALGLTNDEATTLLGA